MTFLTSFLFLSSGFLIYIILNTHISSYVINDFKLINYRNFYPENSIYTNSYIIKSVWANKYSRNSPEMDLLISSINNPSWEHGPLKINRPHTTKEIYKVMESLLKRKLHMNDIKKIFYKPIIKDEDYFDTEQIYIPPFRPEPKPLDIFATKPTTKAIDSSKGDGIKLIGRDIPFIKDGKINIEKQRYKFEDILAQTLISALLEHEEITKFEPSIVKYPLKHPKDVINNYNSQIVKELLNNIVVMDKDSPVYIPHVDPENLEHIPGYNYSNFTNKLYENYTKFLEKESNVNFSHLFTNLLNQQEELNFGNWTEYLETELLSYLYKYSNLENNNIKISQDESMYDHIYMFLNFIKIKFIKSQFFKSEYKLLNKYIQFNLNRKSSLKKMPYWIWVQYWYNREDFINENLYEILKEIVITDPKADLGKITSGLFEYTNPLKKINTFNILSKFTINNINKYFNYVISKFDKISPKVNEIQHIINSYSQEKIEPIGDFSTDVINMNDIIDKLVKDHKRNLKLHNQTNGSWSKGSSCVNGSVSDTNSYRDTDVDTDTDMENILNEKLDKNLLGYEFRNILSFKKFEEEYRKHNMKHFGRPDYCIKKGQLIKGKVYKIFKDKVIVDIHANILAQLSLINFFHSPKEVPVGGFKNLFNVGDELMFEIIELFDHKIELSMKNIRKFHKFRKILENKNNIFLTKVLQRYYNGILVQYCNSNSNSLDTSTDNNTNSSDTNSNSSSNDTNTNDTDPYMNNLKDLSNCGFVPLKSLTQKYKNDNEFADINLVGQVIPVTFEYFEHVSEIPILSNREALKRLQIIYLKEGDIVKGQVIKYKPYSLVIKFGHLEGSLFVNDMNIECYKQHLVTYPKYIITQVKHIDHVIKLPYLVILSIRNCIIMLSNKDIYDLSEEKLSMTNQFLKEFESYSLEENLENYQKFMSNYTYKEPNTIYNIESKPLTEWTL
ncbi:uncharacterized protein TA11015 [Theileria annulata]|uniref:S1 motif domain-containing protein n=1 Tax=Theileria annulata TaxID=5874 RepID=Q4U995_THEAN|nr:uncharacterized protein TA11015 [Theileria annulata]CAI76608.1 hypothetical protein, conserved [Theileria annulata]|eukprot:XP_953233.1 hypothetical protein, conserved [Theileria annulata]